MTKREEVGTVVVVLLLLVTACNFAFGMGKSMGEYEARRQCEIPAVPLLPLESIR